ncbi:MAG: cation transporter, partial [bacterium]|nr:cation transporter [bacterium]
MGHNHCNDQGHHSHNISGKNLGVAVFLNILITVFQFLGGIVSGSVALLTDALHNFSDVISLLLSYFTNRLARRKPTIKQTYGFKRGEILSALINSLTLIAIAIFLIVEALERFSAKQTINSNIVIYFALGSIIINFISVVLLHKDSKESLNIKSAYLHLLTDVMTSIAVMIGGILMKYFNIYWIDSVLSICIAAYLIFSSYKLLRTSLKILMQFTPQEIDFYDVRDQIISIENIENIHHVHLWQLNDKDLYFEAHTDLKKDINITEFQDILSKIEMVLFKNGITHSNIQPEF